MKSFLSFLFIPAAIIVCIAMTASISTAEAPELNEVGWIERVRLMPGSVVLHAKIDTGADHCSLHAKNIEFYRIERQQWVRFSVRTRKGEEHFYERPVVRIAKIKRLKGRTQDRPVVPFTLCLGSSFREVEVNLVDRSNFAYPMLVGRSFLSGNVVINPAKTFTTEPKCDIQEMKK